MTDHGRALTVGATGALGIGALALGAQALFASAVPGAPGLGGWIAGLGFDPGELQAFAVHLARRLALVLAVVVVVLRFRGGDLAGLVRSRVRPATGEAVALMRIVSGAALTLGVAGEHLPSLAALPREMLRPPPPLFSILFALPGADAFLSSELALGAFQALVLVACGAATLGLRSRVSLPAAVALTFLFGGLIRAPYKFFHTGLAPLLVLAVLACDARAAGARWSVDAWAQPPLRPSRGEGTRFGWLRFAGAAVVAALYVEAGLSKLCHGGLHWFEAAHLRSLLVRDSLEPMEFDFDLGLALARLPDGVLEILGAGAMAGELLFFLVFVHRTFALVLPLAMLAMHLGILLAQNILFLDLMLLDLLFVGWWFLDRRRPLPRTRLVPDRRARRATFALLSVFAVVWTFGIEAYPLTAVQMYSHKTPGPVVHHRLLAEHVDGSVTRARPEALFPILRDGRYRRTLHGCFTEQGADECDAFLGTVHGELARREPTLVALRAERWAWDLEAHPHDPDHGTRTAVVRYPRTP
ncbi:MAG: hypothetical protein CMN30_27475 [Sandaracinus sp.]|nr:hypothetical protein [Sandaracinus sp.]MAQ18528.1 hypothetical protein [Sandaracinus sp.]